MASNRNIIIIEDNETFSLLVTHYLKNNLVNANVFVENSGKKAIESIRRLNPSIVILDYYLEDQISAVDVMEVINAMKVRPRVILLSSIKNDQEIEGIMRTGIAHFIPKSNESIYDLLKVVQEELNDLAFESSANATSGMSLWSWVGIAGLVMLLVWTLHQLGLF